MKSIGTLEVGQALLLLQRLKKEGVPAELIAVTDESGIDFQNVMVEDADFERGCDALEAWEVEIRKMDEARARLPCPKCRSGHTDIVPHGEFGYIYQCKACGEKFEK